MRLDHVSYAAGPTGLEATAEHLGQLLGVTFVDGGVHPRFGTRNAILPLSRGHYLEVLDVLDHPAAEKMPFGQAVKARTAEGGGWLGWVVAVEDLEPIERRLGRSAYDGHRHRPDGMELRWRQIGVTGVIADPQLPFFIRWDVAPQNHPSATADGTVALARMAIAGDHERLVTWLGCSEGHPLDDVAVDWVEPNGRPGLRAVHFSTPRGVVTI